MRQITKSVPSIFVIAFSSQKHFVPFVIFNKSINELQLLSKIIKKSNY